MRDVDGGRGAKVVLKQGRKKLLFMQKIFDMQSLEVFDDAGRPKRKSYIFYTYLYSKTSKSKKMLMDNVRILKRSRTSPKK